MPRRGIFECDVARGLSCGMAIKEVAEVASSITGSLGFVLAATHKKGV